MLELGTRLAEAVREQAAVPDVEIPEGRWLDLPRRGRTWLTELPGPPGAPTVVLLHAVGCTGMLTWFPSVHTLAERYRVVVFDQRWHGRGIISERFSVHDCADDVGALIDRSRVYITKGDCDMDRPTMLYLEEHGIAV